LQACLPTGDGAGDLAADAEKKSRSPSKVEQEQIEQHGGELNWGDERRRWRRTEVKPMDHHDQMREHEEAERMPHTAMAETTGARRNRAAKPSVTHSRQSERRD
jgi:hypothetical protein